ncbi:hypothetical protein BGZ93_004203, partial [Podila epicladia]
MRQWAKHLLSKNHPQAPVTREVTYQRSVKRPWSEVASSGQRGSTSRGPPQSSGTRSAPSSKKMTCTWKPCKDLKDVPPHDDQSCWRHTQSDSWKSMREGKHASWLKDQGFKHPSSSNGHASPFKNHFKAAKSRVQRQKQTHGSQEDHSLVRHKAPVSNNHKRKADPDSDLSEAEDED